MKCPCASEKSYASCCQPYHEGRALPPTPLALMRSRYSAYALKNAVYIIETTHPMNPAFETDRQKWEESILSFCRSTEFIGLTIVKAEGKKVYFIAHLKQKGEPFLLKEESDFEQVHGKWLYRNGKIEK